MTKDAKTLIACLVHLPTDKHDAIFAPREVWQEVEDHFPSYLVPDPVDPDKAGFAAAVEVHA